MMDLIYIALVVGGLLLLFAIVFLYVDFIYWIVGEERLFDGPRRFTDKLLVFGAIICLAIDYPGSAMAHWNNWPVSPPSDLLYLCLLILSCVTAYLYSTIRMKLGPALLEIVINFLLFIAIGVNTMIGIQESHFINWVGGTIPLYILLINALAENYRLASPNPLL